MNEVKIQPLLSIVVPTKNRYQYLKYLIDLILDLKSQDIELLIQDNSDNNVEITQYISEKKSTLLKYFYTERSISIQENTDLAIYNSSGEYICFIGDDDGITPNLVDAVKKLKTMKGDVLLSPSIIYNWPDYEDKSVYKTSASIISPSFTRTIAKVDVKRELNKIIKQGFMSLGKMPRLYQAVVSRNTLMALYKRVGTFTPGPSPDMATAVALSYIADNVYYFDQALIISGQSKHVGGGERLLHTLPRPDELPHLPKAIKNYWDSNVPYYWCMQTIWPVSGIYAMKVMGDGAHKINYVKILCNFIFCHKAYRLECSHYIKNNLKIDILLCLKSINKIMSFIKIRGTFYLSMKNKIGSKYIYRNINNIKEAVKLITQV